MRPGSWNMNLNTIKSDQFKHVFTEQWKFKSLTIEASKKLENLKNNKNNMDVNEKQKLEKEIREFYENQAEAARLR